MQKENYYFFAATLTAITYGDEPPMSSEKFRELCCEFLSSKDAEYLKYCCYDPHLALATTEPTGSDFIDTFLYQQRCFLTKLASLRAKKLNRDLEIDVSEDDAITAKTAFEINNPLEAELYINKERWQALDDLVNINYYDVRSIYCYLLKLQLLEKKRIFDTAIGSAEYQKLLGKLKIKN